MRIFLVLVALMVGHFHECLAEEPAFEIYGFVQTDYVQDFRRIDPASKDTLRPSRIPVSPGAFGGDGQAIISVRQSRLGVKTANTKLEFDFFGVGSNEGKTTPRLRHAYAHWGEWLAGQTYSLFMDVDSVPDTLDYSGPCGMIFLRNPQIRWNPISGPRSFAIAIEGPGSTVDSSASELGDDKVPDLTSQYRMDQEWGHIGLGGILRRLGVEGEGSLGWGLNLTSRINLNPRDLLNLGFAYGRGFGTYIGDSGADIVADAATLRLFGLVAYFDHRWNARWNSVLGYSRMQIDTSELQSPEALRIGEYASLSLLYAMKPSLLIGSELLWGRRWNHSGERGNDFRTQVSLRYHFSGSP